MQLIQDSFKNFFKLPEPDRPVPNGFFKSLWIFIKYFITEQIILGLAVSSVQLNLAPLGILIFIILTWSLIRELHHYQNLFNGGQNNRPKIMHVIYAILTGYALAIGYNIIVNYALHLNIANKVSENQANLTTYYHNPYTVFILIVFGVILAPMIEEFGFRYLIIKPTKQSYNKLRIIASIFFFGFAHVAQQLSQVFNHQISFNIWCYYLGQYAMIGLVLAFVYQKYRNYKFNIAIHMSWNAIALLVGVLTTLHK